MGVMSKRIYLSPPHMGPRERQLLLDAFDSNWIAPLGPHVDLFEQEFAAKLGVPHAVAVSSGTAALHLALVALGVGTGDIVLTSTLTFVASANAIRYVGAEPIFIDCESDSWNLDPVLLESELRRLNNLGRRPKAVLVVDICGQSANWTAIKSICDRYGVATIEDAAESLGAVHADRPAGTWADIGCFSFNGNKIITTSGGGMVVTSSPTVEARIRKLATQAREPVPHYEHREVGFNYRLSNLLAAIGRGQLSKLDHRVRRRRANFDDYQQRLSDVEGIAFMPEPAGSRASRWLTCLTVDASTTKATPHAICAHLASLDIEARPLWKPMHQQPAYADFRVVGGRVADKLFASGLCLPSGSNLTADDRRRVVAGVKKSLRAGRMQRAA
jgi:pyridoxal phosphate-dependent aminotransferase EpsN